MPKKTYKINEDIYDIEESDVSSFLKQAPNAKEVKSFLIGKDTFDVEIPDVDAFLKQVPDAKPLFDEVKKKEQAMPVDGQQFGGKSKEPLLPLTSNTASPSVSKKPKSIIPSEFTVEKPVSTATADNRDLALTVESRSQRKDYLGKVSEGVLDIINKNPDIYISQKDMPTMYGEKVIPAGTPKVENISKAVDLYAEKIKKETGKELSTFDKESLVQSALSSLEYKKVEASAMRDLKLLAKNKLPITALTGIKNEKGAVVKEGMFEENIKNIVSEEQKRLEQIAKTPSKEISAEFAPEIEQLKVEVDNTSAALKSEMQSAFTSKFDEIKENLFLEYDGLVKSGQISADEANAQMKKELETVGAQLESDTNILYAPKFEQLNKDVKAKSQEIQTRYNRKVKAQFDLEKEKASKRIESEVSKYKDALPKGYLEEAQSLYQESLDYAMKMDGIKKINEFSNLGNFEKMQTAIMAGWGDVASTIGGSLSYVGVNTGNLQNWAAQSGLYNELPVFNDDDIFDNLTNIDWWIANGVRSIPFSIATMPVGIVGGAGAGMLAKALGAGKRAQMISSVVGGGLVGWDVETFLEAGGGFNDAIREGKSVSEAAEIAAAIGKYNYSTLPMSMLQMLPVFGKSFKFLGSAGIEAGSGYFEEVNQGWAQAKAKAQSEGQDVSYLDYATSPQAIQEGAVGSAMSQGFTLLSLKNTPEIDKQINTLMTSIGMGGESQALEVLKAMKNNGAINDKEFEEATNLLNYTLTAISQTQNINVDDNIKSALVNRFVAIEKAKELLTENENDLASQAAKELIEEKEKEIKNILKGSEPVYLVKIKGNDIPVVSTKEQVDAILSNPASLPLFEIEVYNDIKTQASLDEAYSKQTKDAIQESSTGEVLQRQQEEAGITGSERTGVEQGEQGKKVAQEGQAKEEVEDEFIEVPEDELAALEQEVEEQKVEGNVEENIGQKAYLGAEEGMIKMHDTEKNTVVFETNNQIIDLGQLDLVSGRPIVSFGLSKFPQEGIRTEPKTQKQAQAVKVDGKEYEIIGRARDKKGLAVVKLKEKGTGLIRRLKGDKAERVLKDLSLQVDSRPVAVKLKTEGKEKPAGKTDKQIKAEEKARKSEERKKAREAFQEKTLEELKQEEAKSEKLIEQFEKQALAEAVKNVKNTSLVQVGEKIFQVTKKADGVFSVSQMREDGKMVGIKDEKSRKEAISAFSQEKGKKENEELAKAQKLIEDFKNEEKDRFEALLDKAINSLSSKGRAFDATIGLPIFVAKSALQIIKVGYKAGKSLKEAIADGYKYIKDMGYVSVSEFDFKQYVLSELTNKPKEKEAKEQKAEVKEQEFTENVLEIAKETGLSPQQIENTYKKYDGSKNIEEITIEDYNNARATGDKAKLEVSAKAFDALLQQESAKTATSPTANKNAKESLKGVDEKALKEASKIMEHINDIRANLQEFKIIESTSCKWGK
jgi:methylphosphotriester-DNA--protein-cysteine methyltransferase